MDANGAATDVGNSTEWMRMVGPTTHFGKGSKDTSGKRSIHG